MFQRERHLLALEAELNGARVVLLLQHLAQPHVRSLLKSVYTSRYKSVYTSRYKSEYSAASRVYAVQ